MDICGHLFLSGHLSFSTTGENSPMHTYIKSVTEFSPRNRVKKCQHQHIG